MTKKPKFSQKKEIIYNIINSLLAGIIFFMGSITTNGQINKENVAYALIVSGIVFVTQFKTFWDSEKEEYCKPKLFSFVK